MFRFQKINSFIYGFNKNVIMESIELDSFVYKECDYKTDNVLPLIDDSFKPFIKNQRWGGKKDEHYWFYARLNVPEDDMELQIITGREGLWDADNPQFIVYVDGKIVQALDINHTTYRFEKAGSYEVYLYAYTGTIDNVFLEFKASLNKINRLAEQFYYDVKVPLEICEYLPVEDYDRKRILEALNEGIKKINLLNINSDEYNQSIKEAIATIKEGLYEKYADSSDATTICIGHTHIDIAWMWTVKQTREKAVRSFATVVSLMNQYPNYKFMSSQAILFKFVKEDAPELYEEIKQLVKEGRFEIEGAMWVEADCNLSSGESLIRQILYGKRYFKKEFDKDCKVLWLPDVFGYSAALPQILQKSGVDTFVTSKISWNETNKMPDDTFMWQGIDGTEIFTYFLTAQDKKLGEAPVNHTTYVADIKPSQIAGTWDRYSNKLLSDETILTFGYGDGGGGPTKKMLEYQKRLEYGIIGCPKAKIDTVTNFIDRLKKKAYGSSYLRKWVGELYLELHRGTYTTLGKNKRNNRKGEYLLRNIEWLSVMGNGEYRTKEINDNWEILLTNQFHDIIPGSSIKEVYDESDASYEVMFKSCKKLFDENIRNICSDINTDGGVVVFNPNSFVNSGEVFVDGEYIYAENIPPMGYKVINPASYASVYVTENIIENNKIKVVFDKDMNIASIYDKENEREVLAGKGNQLIAYEDIPLDWDAWDVSDHYPEKPWTIDNVVGVQLIDKGIKKGIRVERHFNNSVIIQDIVLCNNSARVDIETYVDWKESHVLLKAHFPVNILSSKATYDIQYGTLERPTHHNTSWDKAKFEVCAHKFADLSQPDYGVSLLSDCKYGYNILGNNMAISLLRCPTHPNPEADKCQHNFTYSIYPHNGDHRVGETSKEGYKLNNPMLGYVLPKQSGSLQSEYSFAMVDKENIFIEAIKKAEDDDSIIIRLYDAYGICSKPEITLGFNAKDAYIADMSENIIGSLQLNGKKIAVDVKPFEIITLKITK